MTGRPWWLDWAWLGLETVTAGAALLAWLQPCGDRNDR